MKKILAKSYYFLTSLLFLLIIILSIKCFNKEYILDIDKDKIAKLYTNIFNFKTLFRNTNDETVDNEIVYIKTNDKYICSSNNIVSIYDGVVEKCDSSNIVITQNNRYTICFYGDFNLMINKGDYVEKGSIIAGYFEPFTLLFCKDGEIFTYEEYISNSL